MTGSLARIGALACVVGSGCAGEETVAPASLGVPRFQVVRGWPEVPEGELLGQVSGVGIDPDGDVLLFRRAEKDWDGGPIDGAVIPEATVLRFDAGSGALLGSLGEGSFVMPHGLTVDARGHIWLTDVGLHQVFELDARGEVLRSWGEAFVPGEDDGHFDRPTDVAVAEDGTFFVSDGYRNGRVVKFSAEGEVVATWGRLGSAPGELQVPHGIAIGPGGDVFVADRGNARVQRFSSDGRLVGVWQSAELGRPWALTFDGEGLAYVVDGGDQSELVPERARILIADETGSVLGSFGSFGNRDGELIRPHDIAVGADGSVVVVEVGRGQRAQKFERAP